MIEAAAAGRADPTPAPTTLEFTILIPCLNEAETLATCIRKARGSIERLGLEGEVVVADNGSTDGSQAIAEKEGARVVDVPVRGYGAALYHGTMAARGRYVIMGDADDSYDFSRLDDFVAKLREGNEVVMGNRFQGGIRPGAMPWKNRYIGNPVLSGIGKLFFRCPVGDFHCGLRGFSREAFQRMRLQTTGMEFASEMVIKATLLKLRIAEVPTTLDKDGRSRPPHLRPWRDGWRHLRFMLLYSPRWLFLYPGIVVTLLGLTLGIAILRGPLAITRHVALDVNSLLVAFAAVVLGFQAVAFSICARSYAYHEGLLPPNPKLDRAFQRFKLETGLIVGAVVFLAGLAGILYTVWIWYRHGFGALDAQDTLRLAIPGVTALCVGGQIVLVSFLLSFMELRRRRHGSSAPP
jgi:glycosyltransferase involved in cell wall biosynthesis